MNYQVTTETLNIRSGPGTEYEIVGDCDQDKIVTSPDTEGWLPIVLEDDTIGWVSKKYLALAPEDVEPEKPAVPITVLKGTEPPWIVMARKYLGTKEAPGSADNPTIVGWDKLMTTLPADMRHDATPWCAIFVHAMFHLAGIDPKVESAAAVDWLKFGKTVSTPQVGDVVVFEWDSGSHHVAFVLSAGGGMVNVIGGNQSDAVTLASYSTKYVLGYRRMA